MKLKATLINGILTGSVSLILILGLAACKKSSDSSSPTEEEVILHDNLVMLVPWQWNPTLAFSLENHSITSGQPWSGCSASIKDGFFTIDARAGRKASSGVADWFRSNATNAICSDDCNCVWPSELNFAFTGTITVNGDSYQVTIGQGSTVGHNNWWIGGPGWTIHEGITPNVRTPDGKYYFEPEENSSDQIWVKTEY
jgi:hypothetical protein